MSNTKSLATVLFFFFLLFFLFFFFFFYLRKYVRPFTHLRLTKPSPFSFSLSFSEYIYIPIFRKGRRKNSFSSTYLWQGLLLRFLSLSDEWHSPRIGWISLSTDLCPKILFYAFYGDLSEHLAVNRRLYPPTSVLETKESFPNFLWRKGIILALKCLANHFAFFLLPLFPLVVLLEWPAFPSLSNWL